MLSLSLSPANFSNWRRWIGRIWHCKWLVENKQLGQLGTVKSFGIIASSDLKSDLDLTVPIGCARSVNPHQLTPWDWSNFLGSRLLISNGPTEIWVFNIKKKDNTRSSQHRNKNTRLSTWTLWKIGQKPKWPTGQVPFRSPPAMPCFSAFEKVKESVKDSLKRRLNCASLLSRPSWISTCLPLDERPVSQMVDDTTQIPDDLYQSLLQAGRQAKSTTSGQHRTHLQPNGRLVLRLTSMTKAQEAQNLKFCIFGWRKADWIFREAWSLGEEDRVKQHARVYFRLGWKPATLHSDLGRWNTYCVAGKRTSKILTRLNRPLKRWTSFTRLVSEELKKNWRS